MHQPLGKQFTPGRYERLKSRKLVEQLFKSGKSLNIFPFRVYYLLHKGPPGAHQSPVNVQCGFGVSSRQFKKAADRNRVKRVTREAWRLQKQVLIQKMQGRPQYLALFLVYTGAALPDFTTVQEKLTLILNKLITIADETGKIHS